MELNHLKSFYEVARCGTFTAAADKLYLTQPALSRQISALEEKLHLTLFVRHSRGVYLTEAGQRLFDYTKQILNLLNNTERMLEGIADLKYGILSVGASSTIGTYLLPIWLSKFIDIYPNIELSIQISNSREIISKVLAGELELAFVAGPLNINNLEVHTILEDELLLVSSEHHPLVKKPFSPTAMSNETFILREKGSYTRLLSESIMNDLNIKSTKIIEFNTTEAIKRMVMYSNSLTFLSKYTISTELKDKLLYSMKSLAKRPFHSIHKKQHLSPSSKAFLNIVNSDCQETNLL